MSQRSRFKQKGRGGASFVSIPHFVLESSQWGELPGKAVKLLFELARQYKGNNNGDLSATISMLRDRGWTSDPILWKYIGVLEEAGWIVRTRQGGRHIGCNLYAITWWPIDPCDGKHQHAPESKASHRWKNAIGTSKTEVRNPLKQKCKDVELLKQKRKVVPLRPVA